MAPRTKSHCVGQRMKCATISGCKLTKSSSTRNSYCRKVGKTQRKGRFASPKTRVKRHTKMSHDKFMEGFGSNQSGRKR